MVWLERLLSATPRSDAVKSFTMKTYHSNMAFHLDLMCLKTVRRLSLQSSCLKTFGNRQIVSTFAAARNLSHLSLSPFHLDASIFFCLLQLPLKSLNLSEGRSFDQEEFLVSSTQQFQSLETLELHTFPPATLNVFVSHAVSTLRSVTYKPHGCPADAMSSRFWERVGEAQLCNTLAYAVSACSKLCKLDLGADLVWTRNSRGQNSLSPPCDSADGFSREGGYLLAVIKWLFQFPLVGQAPHASEHCSS